MKWNLRYCLIVVYNKIVLTKTYQLCRNYVFRFRYKHLPKSYESIRNNLIEKKKINVAFLFMMQPSGNMKVFIVVLKKTNVSILIL